MSNRKAFNFLKSYFDVYNMLDNNEDKKQYIEAILNRQFNGIHPVNLSKMAEFAYNSQKHAIDKSVKGFEDKTKTKVSDFQTNNKAIKDPCQGGVKDPSKQEKEKEKEKEEYNGSGDKSPNLSIDFDKLLKFINNETGRRFKIINSSVKSKYKARLKDGYNNQDIANAIKNAVLDNYHKDTNFKYLTPEFFSRANIIDKYAFKSKNNKKDIDDWQKVSYKDD